MNDAKLLTRIVHGSRLYGTNTPLSDSDFKSVHLPSGTDILLGRSLNVEDYGSKGDRSGKNTKDDTDDSSYALAKFLKLLVDGDTSGVEILLAPKQFRAVTSDEFEEILSYKDRLLNRKSKGFVGYVKSQSVKYSAKGDRLKTARAVVKFLQDLHNGPQKLIAAASKVGYYEDRINQFVKDNDHCSIKTLTTPSGVSIKHLEVCGKLLPFTNTIVSGINMYRPMEQEYGARAKQAADNKGVDWKAVSHAIRVGEEAIELLRTGDLIFPRPNAEYLLKVKLGQLAFDGVSAYLETLLDSVDQAARGSKLPENSDMQLVESLILKFHRGQIL